jgi:hypothetical protein
MSWLSAGKKNWEKIRALVGQLILSPEGLIGCGGGEAAQQGPHTDSQSQAYGGYEAELADTMVTLSVGGGCHIWFGSIFDRIVQ